MPVAGSNVNKGANIQAISCAAKTKQEKNKSEGKLTLLLHAVTLFCTLFRQFNDDICLIPFLSLVSPLFHFPLDNLVFASIVVVGTRIGRLFTQ